MNEQNRQLDEVEWWPSERLGRDLKALCCPPGSVPLQIDRALSEQIRCRLTKPSRRTIRLRWAAAAAVAACLAVAALCLWEASRSELPAPPPRRPVASSGDRPVLTIESLDGRGPMMPGTRMQTAAGEVQSVLLNDRHHVVIDGGTRLSIESLVRAGRPGCRINLAAGQVCVHVQHDGNPFVVRTPHGRAVITGTTFSVQVTDKGTTLVVAEGAVRFESGAGAVRVAAGQQSSIATAAALPSTPEPCDAIALMAWATSQEAGASARDAIADNSFLDDWVLSLLPSVRTDLEDVRYPVWVERNRGWFERQFADFLRLREALAAEGVEVEYPDLLLASGVLWQFAYPPAGPDRLLAVGDAPILKAANRFGKDRHWLRDRGLLPFAPPPVAVGQKQGMEAFTVWQDRIGAAAAGGGEFPEGLLLDSLHACVYLRQTRTLIWLAVETGRYSPSDPPPDELQALLRAELVAADSGIDDIIQLLTMERSVLLLTMERSVPPCDGEVYHQLLGRLHDAVAQVAQTEGRLADEVKIATAE